MICKELLEVYEGPKRKKNMKPIELGTVYLAPELSQVFHSYCDFAQDVQYALSLYSNWNFHFTESMEDVEQNFNAAENKDGMILARYPTCLEDIWICTHFWRNPRERENMIIETTILFPREW